MQTKYFKPFEKILLSAKTIVIVGLSKNPQKDSHDVASYLKSRGYKIIPVNPTADEVLGEKCYHSLSEVNETVDIVDVFRPSEECEEITREALKLSPKLVWLQLGIENENAKKLAEAAKIEFVQNHCIKIEHKRLTN